MEDVLNIKQKLENELNNFLNEVADVFGSPKGFIENYNERFLKKFNLKCRESGINKNKVFKEFVMDNSDKISLELKRNTGANRIDLFPDFNNLNLKAAIYYNSKKIGIIDFLNRELTLEKDICRATNIENNNNIEALVEKLSFLMNCKEYKKTADLVPIFGRVKSIFKKKECLRKIDDLILEVQSSILIEQEVAISRNPVEVKIDNILLNIEKFNIEIKKGF